MALTRQQAKDAMESCADVFTTEGDAGVIERVHTFLTMEGTVTKARLYGRHVQGKWFPLSGLDTAETLQDRNREVKVEDLAPGMRLDQGIFAGREEATWQGEVNPRTWEIRLADGTSYVESRGASVRVWN